MAPGGVLEVEAKLRLGPGEADALRERLLRGHWLRGALEVQADTYFAHPQRDFAQSDEALRLRATAVGLELTYKGPRNGGTDRGAAGGTRSAVDTGGVKVRQEETVRLRGDPTSVLAGLGFRPSATVRKKREHWSRGAVSVGIDLVDGLGEFVEVEALGPDGAAATRAVEEALQELGLSGAQRVAASYLEMLQGPSP